MTISIVLGLLACQPMMTLADESTDYTNEQLAEIAKIETQLQETVKMYEETANSVPVQSDPKDFYRAAKGSWSWRDGLICITTKGKGNQVVNTWHAAIVAPQQIQSVAEAPGENQQVRFTAGWWEDPAPYTVYQVAVNSTSVQEDWNAGQWAGRQIGKPYNTKFWDSRRTDRFYCSQLVWAAYYYTAGVDLNKNDNDLPWGFAIHPGEFVTNSNTTIVYRSR